MNLQPTNQYIEPFLLLNNSDGCYRVPLTQIVYCSSYNSTTTFQLFNQHKIVVAKPLSYYQQLLNPYGFVRIHHNTILNIHYLCHCQKGDDTSQIILTTGDTLTMSRPKKAEVINALKHWSIEPTIQVNAQPKQVSGKYIQHSQNLNTERINLTF